MKRRLFLGIAAVVMVLLLPISVLAADATDADGFMFRVGGTTTVTASERLETVIIVNGDAVVDGAVESTIWVVNGDAIVNGQVDGDITVIDGTLTLGPAAVVNDVLLMRSELARDPSAVVNGDISERSEYINFGWGNRLFSFGFWIGSTAALIVAGLVVTALAGSRISRAGSVLTERQLESFVFAFLLWIALPVLGVIAILTLIGIPLGIMLLLSFPLVWLIGYTVAGERLGRAIAPRLGLASSLDRPYWHVVIGIVTYQLIGLIPFIGGLTVVFAGFIGSGAVISLAYRSRSARSSGATPVMPEAASAPS